MRSAREWQSLLDGTSEAPWVANPHGNIFASVDGRSPDMDGPYNPDTTLVIGRFRAWHVDRDVLDPANSRLAAAAPESVAELVRLRTELVELRDYYRRREVASQSRVDAATNSQEQEHYARFAHHHKRTHEALTRILEGQEESTDDK